MSRETELRAAEADQAQRAQVQGASMGLSGYFSGWLVLWESI